MPLSQRLKFTAPVTIYLVSPGSTSPHPLQKLPATEAPDPTSGAFFVACTPLSGSVTIVSTVIIFTREHIDVTCVTFL